MSKKSDGKKIKSRSSVEGMRRVEDSMKLFDFGLDQIDLFLNNEPPSETEHKPNADSKKRVDNKKHTEPRAETPQTSVDVASSEVSEPYDEYPTISEQTLEHEVITEPLVARPVKAPRLQDIDQRVTKRASTIPDTISRKELNFIRTLNQELMNRIRTLVEDSQQMKNENLNLNRDLVHQKEKNKQLKAAIKVFLDDD